MFNSNKISNEKLFTNLIGFGRFHDPSITNPVLRNQGTIKCGDTSGVITIKGLGEEMIGVSISTPGKLIDSKTIK